MQNWGTRMYMTFSGITPNSMTSDKCMTALHVFVILPCHDAISEDLKGMMVLRLYGE